MAAEYKTAVSTPYFRRAGVEGKEEDGKEERQKARQNIKAFDRVVIEETNTNKAKAV